MTCITNEEKTLNSQEICSIIKECGAHNVSYFRLDKLEIEFYIEGREKPTPEVSEPTPVQDIATKDSIIKCEEDYTEDISMELKAEELASLHLTDPSKYEELLANPELVQEFMREIDETEGE